MLIEPHICSITVKFYLHWGIIALESYSILSYIRITSWGFHVSHTIIIIYSYIFFLIWNNSNTWQPMSNSFNISNCVTMFIDSLRSVIQRLVNHLEINSSLASVSYYLLIKVYYLSPDSMGESCKLDRIAGNLSKGTYTYSRSHHLHSRSRELHGQHPIDDVKHHKWQWEAYARPPVHLRLHRFNLFFWVGTVLHKLCFRLSSTIKAKPVSSPCLGMSVRLHVSVHDTHKVFLFRILRRVKKGHLFKATSIYTELTDLGNGKLSSTQIILNALDHS